MLSLQKMQVFMFTDKQQKSPFNSCKPRRAGRHSAANICLHCLLVCWLAGSINSSSLEQKQEFDLCGLAEDRAASLIVHH